MSGGIGWARKLELSQIAVRLNGKPARISRRMVKDGRGPAYVEQLASGLGCEWSWEAADRIARAGGDFRTLAVFEPETER